VPCYPAFNQQQSLSYGEVKLAHHCWPAIECSRFYPTSILLIRHVAFCCSKTSFDKQSVRYVRVLVLHPSTHTDKPLLGAVLRCLRLRVVDQQHAEPRGFCVRSETALCCSESRTGLEDEV
jgi:hypothetical protein